MQMRQRRAGEGVEGAVAIAAFVAAQALDLAPRDKALRLAMTAGGGRRKLRIDQRHDLAGRALASQRLGQGRPLHAGQIAQLLDKPSKILRFHAILAPLRITD